MPRPMESPGVGHDFKTEQQSATHQPEPAEVHVSPPSRTPATPHPTPSQSAGLSSVSRKAKSHRLSISPWKCGVNTALSIHLPPFPAVPTGPFSASPLVPCKQVHLHHLSRFRTYGETRFLTGHTQLGVSGPFTFKLGRGSLPRRLASAVRWLGSHPQS